VWIKKPTAIRRNATLVARAQFHSPSTSQQPYTHARHVSTATGDVFAVQWRHTALQHSDRATRHRTRNARVKRPIARGQSIEESIVHFNEDRGRWAQDLLGYRIAASASAARVTWRHASWALSPWKCRLPHSSEGVVADRRYCVTPWRRLDVAILMCRSNM